MKTKMNFCKIYALGVLWWVLPAAGQAATFSCTTNNNEITITGLLTLPPDGAMDIPTNINGFKVTTIAEGAFSGRGMTSVTIPDSVTTINAAILENEFSLTNISIGNGATNITLPLYDDSPFVTTVTVGALNPDFSAVGGVLFDKKQTTLLAYPGGGPSSYVIPGTVTNIWAYAFFLCGNVTNITFPKGVTTCDSQAFRACSHLAGAFFQGDAPGADFSGSAFGGDTNATVYYRPGTTGWSDFFASAPAVLWNPRFTNSSASFGDSGEYFSFYITGTTNIPFLLEACTNLANPAWTVLQSSSLPISGAVKFTDMQAANFPKRFYRIRSP